MISVVVPVYNKEFYLDECAASVLAQTYADFELILVDDGSTDRSGAICDDIARRDSRVRVLHTANGGLSAARNHGIDAARGSHLYFIDADDLMHPRSLEVLARTAGATGCEIVCGGIVYARSCEFGGLRGLDPVVVDSVEAIKATLYQRANRGNWAWGKLYARRLFDTVRFRPGTWYEDLDVFYRLYELVDRVAYIDETLYFYRRDDNSFINRWSRGRLDVLEVTGRMERYIAGHVPEALAAARERRMSAAFNMLALKAANPGCVPAEVAELCRQVIRERRRDSLTDKNVRLKNKAGILLSYLGFGVFEAVARMAAALNR